MIAKPIALCTFLGLIACSDWPTPGTSTPGPWPGLVPLSSLDLGPASADADPTAVALRGRAVSLSARGLQRRPAGDPLDRGAALALRAEILRGPAATDTDRAAMREELARL